MIYDQLSNIELYKGIHENLDKAIAFLASCDLSKLPLGRTEIDGDNVYINVMETKAQPLEERSYEVHKNHMDIQMDIAGTERIDTGDTSRTILSEYDEEKDVAAAHAPDLAQCTIGTGNFIICMANEPHKPNIAVGTDTYLKKAVCKVRIRSATAPVQP